MKPIHAYLIISPEQLPWEIVPFDFNLDRAIVLEKECFIDASSREEADALSGLSIDRALEIARQMVY